MESLRELNAICQKPDYQTVGNWMVRKILRPAALPITWLLLHTSVTANQVTAAALFMGLLGNVLIALPGAGAFLAGVICLQLWYLLDHVDGQIARYRKTSGLTGRFYDFLMHHLVHGTVVFALGWHVFLMSGEKGFVLIGFAGTLGVLFFNMLYDIQYKTFYEKWLRSPGVTLKSNSKVDNLPRQDTPAGWGRKVFAILHKCLEMHVMMNTLTAAAIARFFWLENFKPRLFLCLFYAFLAAAMAVLKYTLWIKEKRVDKEFYQVFDENSQKETHE